VVAASPNALGQPTAAGAYATAAAYHPDGQLKSFAFGNGALYSATLNARNLLGNISVGTAASLAVSEDFAYDKNANITAIHDLVGSGQRTRTMTYDGMNRLLSATAAGLWGTEGYTYDAANNIRSITNASGTSTYNYGTSNLLDSITGANAHIFQYDSQGNTTQRDNQAMVFDLANRLLSVTGKGDYLYDTSGRRVRSVSPSGTTYYAYNAAGQLLWQFDPATNAGTDYVYLGKKLIAKTSGAASTSTVPSLSAPSSAVINTAYTVAWTAVSGTTSYELQERSGNGTWTSIASGNALSKAVTHTAAATFGYQVRACNGSTCGAWSATATTVVSAGGAVPAPPSKITATLSADEQSISATWTASGGATSYEVQYGVGGTGWVDAYSGAALSSTVPTPSADATYTFRVRACGAGGCSGWRTGSNVLVRHTPSKVRITVPATSSGQVAISWTSDVYAKVYHLQRSVDNISFTTVYSSTSGTSTVQNVETTGTYFYRINACNSEKCSDGASAAVTVTIPPTGRSTLTVPTQSDGCYAVSWTPVATSTSYVLQEQVDGGAFTAVANDGSGTWNACGKAKGTYGYRLQGCNAGGCGPFSSTATTNVLLVPAAPSGVITAKSGSGANIRFQGSWNAVDTASRYEVYRNASTLYSGGSQSVLLQAGAATTLTDAYTVRACNASGCSSSVAFPSP
jgi:YD repeat-containing protein